jgi:hypothetical protein
MLNIEYQAETEDDMADLLSSLLMARSTAFMAKKFIATRIELSEGYYELQGAFDTIQTLIKPALGCVHTINTIGNPPALPGVFDLYCFQANFSRMCFFVCFRIVIINTFQAQK